MNKFWQRVRDDSRQDRDVAVRIWVALLIVFLLAAVVAWSFLPPPLPKVVRFGTGPADGYFNTFGEELRQQAAEHGVDLRLVATDGSVDNIQLLLDGKLDAAVVQGGIMSQAEAARLQSVASVFYELVLIVKRVDWEADHIEGGRIAIGRPGSGTNGLARELLADQGVREGVPPGTDLVEIGGAQAVAALLAGEVDTGIFVTSLEVSWVRPLFTDPQIRVVELHVAEAFTRHYRYLKRIVIPAGLIDLKSKVPPNDVPVMATTASLVIRPDAHKALIPLLIESARGHLQQGSLFAAPGEFPSASGVEAPLADEALQYFQRGPSFFYQWLPFRYASTATRLTIILIPLLTLMYPLFRLAGPTYRWAIERRIYRWYHVLGLIERRMDRSNDAQSLGRIQEELDRIDDKIRHLRVPSAYASNLFTLRVHHKLLKDRLRSLQDKAGNPVPSRPEQNESNE